MHRQTPVVAGIKTYRFLIKTRVLLCVCACARCRPSPTVGRGSGAGFENFDTKNEFEQLLINFTNESLQDTFNKQVFSNEIRLYEEEGIDVVVSECPDNAECLKMLSAKPNGIIPRCPT